MVARDMPSFVGDLAKGNADLYSNSVHCSFSDLCIKRQEFLEEGSLLMEKQGEKKVSESGEEKDRRLPNCTLALEWAEHARAYGEDEPCDDGRAGHVCGGRKGEEPCPIEDEAPGVTRKP